METGKCNQFAHYLERKKARAKGFRNDKIRSNKFDRFLRKIFHQIFNKSINYKKRIISRVYKLKRQCILKITKCTYIFDVKNIIYISARFTSYVFKYLIQLYRGSEF